MLDLTPAEDERARKAEERAKAAEKRTRELEREMDDLRAVLRIASSVEAANARIPEWLTPARRSKKHRATASLLLSDLHLDEVVKPEQVEFANRYDRRIAELRLRRTFTNTVEYARDYVSGVDIEGIVCYLGGDLVSGNIHEELKESNEATIVETVIHWAPLLAAGLVQLADHFGKVHVPCVVGNHGRLTRKPRAKNRAQDNYDWLLYHWLADRLAGDKRFTWQISDAADTTVPIYGTRYLFTHGDQFRGGSGIAGMLSPLMLGMNRKTRRQSALGEPFDYMVMGHWHTYAAVMGLIVNGSLKGYDEYAYVSNFLPEPPQQAFWLTTPERGITLSAPILALDRAKEGW